MSKKIEALTMPKWGIEMEEGKLTEWLIEEGTSFSPKFNSDGLLPCITIEHETNQILMFSSESDKILNEAMRYSVLGGGKRLRPYLAIE